MAIELLLHVMGRLVQERGVVCRVTCISPEVIEVYASKARPSMQPLLFCERVQIRNDDRVQGLYATLARVFELEVDEPTVVKFAGLE